MTDEINWGPAGELPIGSYGLTKLPTPEPKYLGWWSCSDLIVMGPFSHDDAESLVESWDITGQWTWLEELRETEA